LGILSLANSFGFRKKIGNSGATRCDMRAIVEAKFLR
jgi:hypothetical protein